MTDYVNFNSKIERLREYATYLKDYQKHTINELKDNHTLQGAVLHYLQLAIECVIDVGELLISELRLRKPEEAREVFEILAEHNVIPGDFAKHFAAVANFRNILVHEYAKVDLDKVYAHLQNDLKDFDFYAKCVAKFLQG